MAGMCLHGFLKANFLFQRIGVEKNVSLMCLDGVTCAGLQHKDMKKKHIREVYASRVMLNHQLICIQISWSVFSFKSDFSKVDGPNLISLVQTPLYSITRNVFSLMFCAA